MASPHASSPPAFRWQRSAGVATCTLSARSRRSLDRALMQEDTPGSANTCRKGRIWLPQLVCSALRACATVFPKGVLARDPTPGSPLKRARSVPWVARCARQGKTTLQPHGEDDAPCHTSQGAASEHVIRGVARHVSVPRSLPQTSRSRASPDRATSATSMAPLEEHRGGSASPSRRAPRPPHRPRVARCIQTAAVVRLP